ncbi:MAG TPA: hypothetical protein VJ201_03245 [Candidatus Babeliales bacterium]|nr:hypothetical protein [Candidatus Babeliales bacterium]
MREDRYEVGNKIKLNKDFVITHYHQYNVMLPPLDFDTEYEILLISDVPEILYKSVAHTQWLLIECEGIPRKMSGAYFIPVN